MNGAWHVTVNVLGIIGALTVTLTAAGIAAFIAAGRPARANKDGKRELAELGDDISRDGSPVAFTDADLDWYAAKWAKENGRG